MHVVVDGVHLLFDPSDWFDPHPSPVEGKPDVVLVSHGHSDHANLIQKYNDTVKIMHPATKDILTQYNRDKVRKDVLLRRDQRDTAGSDHVPIKVKGLVIEAFDAGHCIGSVQFKITSPTDGTIVFTGDINTAGSMALAGGKILPADILIIESTMGKPGMNMVPRASAYASVHSFLQEQWESGKRIVAIYGHSIGKGQEMTMLLNSINGNPSYDVYVDPRTAYVNRVYERYLIPMGAYNDTGSLVPTGNGKLSVVFSDLYNLLKSGGTVESKLKLASRPPAMVVSAFPDEAAKEYPVISLSSHDDFDGLNRYVDASVGKKGKVVTFHGFHAELASHLQSRGINAIDAHREIFSS